MIIDPETPLFNTVIFYIMVVTILLIVKPDFMWDQETGRFKSFGFGQGQTLASFATTAIGMGVMLYALFLGIYIFDLKLNKMGS